jgi:LAO/AO transport system kinase
VRKTKVHMRLVENVLAGDRLALARLLSLIENQEAEGLEALADLYPRTGNAHMIGITGAPGTGKSTLVNQLVRRLRAATPDGEEASLKVGVVAVDPSSPFSGGAILGDRIRMRDLCGDPGVFVRSMASRGAPGGLASTTGGVAQALDAAGFDVILIETVGAGQAEVDIARTAHTTVVVTAPGMGDEVQAIKAGILEIADILVVNKADLPGTENAMRALQAMLEMGRPGKADLDGEKRDVGPAWCVPVLCTISTEGKGFDMLLDGILQHRQYLHDSGGWGERERERQRAALNALIRERLVERFLDSQPDGKFEEVLEKVVERTLSPWQAARELLQQENT